MLGGQRLGGKDNLHFVSYIPWRVNLNSLLNCVHDRIPLAGSFSSVVQCAKVKFDRVV